MISLSVCSPTVCLHCDRYAYQAAIVAQARQNPEPGIVYDVIPVCPHSCLDHLAVIVYVIIFAPDGRQPERLKVLGKQEMPIVVHVAGRVREAGKPGFDGFAIR